MVAITFMQNHMCKNKMNGGRKTEMDASVLGYVWYYPYYVKSFFNYGLLCSKKKKYVGVSSDRIEEIKLLTGEVGTCSVEIKLGLQRRQLTK